MSARQEGSTDPTAPETEGFWVASVSGSGEQTLDWTIDSGDWALVIMNDVGAPIFLLLGVRRDDQVLPQWTTKKLASRLRAVGLVA